MEKLKSLKKYTRYDEKEHTLYFTGKQAKIHIPTRYETYGYLDRGNTIKTLGVMNVIVDDKEYAPLCILGIIEIVPSEVEIVTIDNATYLELILNKDDILIKHTDVIQNSNIPYSIFVEFISYGKLPYFFSYDTVSTIFDAANRMTGANLDDVNHSIFELIFAHLYRDKDNLTTFYRLTDMKKEPKFIPLRSVPLATQSTTSKLLGSYFGDGLTSALITENTIHRDVEDYLRR
jgi:hypothetical protein